MATKPEGMVPPLEGVEPKVFTKSPSAVGTRTKGFRKPANGFNDVPPAEGEAPTPCKRALNREGQPPVGLGTAAKLEGIGPDREGDDPSQEGNTPSQEGNAPKREGDWPSRPESGNRRLLWRLLASSALSMRSGIDVFPA